MAGSTTDLLEVLRSRGETLAGLERLLELSPGYLSKVRCQRVTPSKQLVALLDVLVQHPEVRATLRAPSAARKPSASAQRPARSARVVPTPFLRRLTAAWTASRVRYQAVDDLLLVELGVGLPRGLERSLRYLVHPDDRQALADARMLGASVAMASSRASICTLPGTRGSVVVVFPLAPLHHLLEKRPSAVDAALYFALQGGEEAEARLLAIASASSLKRTALQRAFVARYGSVPPLPPKEWLLRATFDPEQARRRLAKLP